MESANNKIKLLYISGFGRSGSTLLDMVFGKLPGIVPVGEMYWIWYRCFQQNQMTGDGYLFKESPFWTEVVNEAYGGFDKVDAKYVDSFREKTQRLRHIFPLADPSRRTPEFTKDFNEISGILGKMYRAIQKVSGAEVIVDSSKYPPYGFLLNAMPDLDVYMLHLVRDSRAVAYSWQRQKVRPEIHWQKQNMPKFGPWRSSRNWLSNNMASGMFRNYNPNKFLFMRYEDFTKDPKGNTQKILDLIGQGHRSLDFLVDGKFAPEPINSVAGNPVRFEKKDIVIRPDAEWREKMPASQRAFVTAVTAPLLVRYGYSPL